MKPAAAIVRAVTRNLRQLKPRVPIVAGWRSCRSLTSFALEVLTRRVIFLPCRFTSFIAKGASVTAKFSFVPAIGREQNVRIAAQRKLKRNFRRLLRRTREE